MFSNSYFIRLSIVKILENFISLSRQKISSKISWKNNAKTSEIIETGPANQSEIDQKIEMSALQHMKAIQRILFYH